MPWNPTGFVADNGDVTYPDPTEPPRSTPGCRSADFELTFDRTGPAPTQGQFRRGWQLTVFTLRYDGRSACALSGQSFGGDLITASGRELPDDRFIGGPFIPARLVRPGQLVLGSVQWAVKLTQEPRPAELVIDPTGSTTTPNPHLAASLRGVAIDPRPGGGFVDGPDWKAAATGYVDTIADAGSTASLRGSYAGPAHVRLGSVLHFAIALENDGPAPVPLDPCPRMADELYVVIIKFPTIIGQHGPVNCARAPTTIRPGRAVTLQVEQSTTGEIAGLSRVYWTLVGTGASGPYVEGGVTIDPAAVTPPTTARTTTTSPSTSTTVSGTSRPSTTTRSVTALAATGTFTAPLAGVALALVLAGVALTVVGRPRRHRH